MNAWLSVSFGYLSALPFYLASSRWSVRERRFHVGNLVFNGLRLAVGLGVLVPRLRKVCGLVISPALQALIAAVVSCSRQTHHGSSSPDLSRRGAIPGEPVQHSKSHQGQQEQDQQTDQRQGTN